ncbi:MAG: hypothetical protein AB9917_11810 [Negativicutes bacterium]
MNIWGLLLLALVAAFALSLRFSNDNSHFRDGRTKIIMDVASIKIRPLGQKDVWTQVQYDPPLLVVVPQYISSHHFLKRYSRDRTVCHLQTIVYYSDGRNEVVSYPTPTCKTIDKKSEQWVWTRLFHNH